ncbi:uncharacterized protein BJX67DRAFT_376337 [Aspergillus lucknowensis]|uniref:Uncharacterized protein n=1 Tax=Aspergillus lucknowensis TaxID=176173 RepID=A0ABR4M7L0_9EURO
MINCTQNPVCGRLRASALKPLDKLETKIKAKKKARHDLRKRYGYGRREDGPDDANVPYYYKLTDAGMERAKKQWSKVGPAPDDVPRQLEKRWRKLEPEPGNSFITNPPTGIVYPASALIRPRLEIMLYMMIKEMKKVYRRIMGDYGYDNIQFLQDTTKIPGIDSINLTTKRTITMPYECKGRMYQVKSEINNVLFSGKPEDLETSLLILRARRYGNGGVRTWTLLKNMAMIHHARKRVGDNAEIYGIATDTYVWAFVHIDNKSRYSRLILDWKTNKKLIINHIVRILDYAAYRAVQATRHTTQCLLNKTMPAGAQEEAIRYTDVLIFKELQAMQVDEEVEYSGSTTVTIPIKE